MKAIVYQTENKAFLYVKIDIDGDGKNQKYYDIPAGKNSIKFNPTVRTFIKKLAGIEFDFVPTGKIEGSLTPQQLEELRIAAEKAWLEKKKEEPKVTVLEDDDDEPKKPVLPEEPKSAAPAGGLRAATSAANTRGGYHYYLETYTKEINAKLKPHAYTVNTATHTLENSNGQKITVNDDGSTEGTLFSNLGDASTAQNIANDHIAVIKMHLALIHLAPPALPIFPAERIVNLYLIQKNLSAAQQAQVPALQAEIKRLIEIEFAKNEYNDIRAMIRYEGQPLNPVPSAPPASLKISGDPKPPAAPPADNDFLGKVAAKMNTEEMWLTGIDMNSMIRYVLQENLCDPSNVRRNSVHYNEIDSTNSVFVFPDKPRPFYIPLSLSPYPHHVLLYADKDNVLHYIDSMKGSNEEIEKELKQKFHDQFSGYVARHTEEQKDGWSCVYRVGREILKLYGLEDKDSSIVSANTSKEIHDAFVAVAEKYNNRIKLKTQTFFIDLRKGGDAADGKLTYCASSETFNDEFFDKISGIATENLVAGITNLCGTDERFRHALLASAPHYIYFDDKNDTRGVGENGMGGNAVGMALMQARNELFREKNPNLIANPETLRDQARQERDEIDRMLGGADKTAGKSFKEINALFRAHKNSVNAPTAPAASEPKQTDSQSKITKEAYLDFLAKLKSSDPKISARALQDIMDGNNVFFHFKDMGFGKATAETGGFRLRDNAEEIFNQLKITPADVGMHAQAFENHKNNYLKYSSAAGILRNGIEKVYRQDLKLTEDPFGLDSEDNEEFQNALRQVLNSSPRPK